MQQFQVDLHGLHVEEALKYTCTFLEQGWGFCLATKRRPSLLIFILPSSCCMSASRTGCCSVGTLALPVIQCVCRGHASASKLDLCMLAVWSQTECVCDAVPALVKLITGRGNHSEGNQPKILPAVKKFLVKEGIDFVAAPGCFSVGFRHAGNGQAYAHYNNVVDSFPRHFAPP